jgi:hypothetical protein
MQQTNKVALVYAISWRKSSTASNDANALGGRNLD